MHAYRTLVKSYAVHIITLDIGLHLQVHGTEVSLKRPESYIKLEPRLKSEEQLTEMLAEAAPSSYAPELHDNLTKLLSSQFPGLNLQQLAKQEPISERDYGGSFAFSMPLLRTRLQAYSLASDRMDDPVEEVEMLLLSVNLNLSLAHAETALVESWEALLRQLAPFLQIDATVRPIFLSITASISYDIAGEQRQGDRMASIHGVRLSLVLKTTSREMITPNIQVSFTFSSTYF